MAEYTSRPVAVVTGASSGIGKEAARALAGMGWQVIGVGRNPQRCAAALPEIREQARNPEQVHMLCADLAVMAETARAADEIAALTDRVDALLNNAGGVTRERNLTAEGNENTFASNHLGHFLLTQCLLPLLRNAAAGPDTPRIVAVSSTGHEHADGLDWEDLQSIDNFVSGPAYCRAKLANILFTRELARRLAPEGIVAHVMHPGVVTSNFASHADQEMQDYIATLDGETPEAAADTLVWLATADDPATTSGDYFYQRERIPTSEAGRDDDAARRLWEESARLVKPWLHS